MPESLRVCYLSAEVAPYAKVGGLGDVSGALPKALAELGHDVRLVLPKYATVEAAGQPIVKAEVKQVKFRLGTEEITLAVSKGTLPGSKVPIYFLAHPTLFAGGAYGDPKAAVGTVDTMKRFWAFSLGALELLRALRWSPDVIHVHDNHVGLVPLYLKTRYSSDEVLRGAATVLTIHNLAYQGCFPLSRWPETGLPPEFTRPLASAEAWGQANMLKAGIVESDVVSTVSPTYAQEIQTEEYGAGLDPVLRSRKEVLFGILNGADYSVWDPRVDPLIPYPYGPGDAEGKARNKAALLQKVGLPRARARDIPVIGLVSRLVEQKGFDILEEAMPEILKTDLRMVFLGTGDPRYHEMLSEVASRYPQKLALRLGFDNALAHLIEAGSDMFLMPSRFEPSGLNQLYSLRYGTVPIVRATGGLADTVVDADREPATGTGFVFEPYRADALLDALGRAVRAHGERASWAKLVERGMKMDFSWGSSAKKYTDLYREAIRRAQARTGQGSGVR